MSKDQILKNKFYSQDGTWRTAEPSWRYLLSQKQDPRGGGTSWTFPLHDPAHISSEGVALSVRHNRGSPRSTSAKPVYASVEALATTAAESMWHVSNKDQKRSGFMNETLVHTDLSERDAGRWGRLGIMTRERLMASDKYGDMAIPHHRPRTGSMQMRTGPVEKTGFTRGAAMHRAVALTGGFEYVEQAEPPKRAPDRYAVPTEVTGRKCPTGYALNNQIQPNALLPASDTHYTLLAIGHAGASSKIDKFGDLQARPASAIDLARAKQGPGDTLQVEESGFTRTKWSQTTNAVPGIGKQKERELHPTQIALRKMADPIEFTDPHAHKARARR